MREREQATVSALRHSIIGATFALGLIIGGVATGLFWDWPLWLVVVLAVGILVQVLVWLNWWRATRSRRPRG